MGMSGIFDDKHPLSAAIVHHRGEFGRDNSSNVHPCDAGNILMSRYLLLNHSERWRKGLRIHIEVLDLPSCPNDCSHSGKIRVGRDEHSTTCNLLQSE